ncbi:hypothetical protein BS47DRAFT_46250 [Hydnum rufescens UP504]|uniref:Uncharacterized protein n=1 Tax=Hydnum rufescens UP504 TaxID=1448309 RepID=A0A9P6DQ47_9AGAM|nr:hypothetical protein BS47DRAFT_46250 [Hydnum rufescens UP504]
MGILNISNEHSLRISHCPDILRLSRLFFERKSLSGSACASPCVAPVWLVLADYHRFPMHFFCLILPTLGFAAG